MGWLTLARRAAAAFDPPGSPIRSPREGTAVHAATDGRDVLANTPDGWEIDNPGLWWQGPAGSDGTGGPFGNPLNGEDPHGLSSLSAVTRCTSLICDTIAGLPWRVVRGEFEELPPPAWISDPQMSRVDGRVVDPSTVWETRLSTFEFRVQWLQAALWFGDGYIYAPVRDSTGAPQPPLWQLHPHDVTIRDGTYWVADVPLPAGSIIHLRGMAPYWSGHGRGVIAVHGAELGLASVVRDYASGVFSSGVPAGYLRSTQPSMDAAQAAALKATWLAVHGGTKRSIAVLNATTEFHPIAISPVDAQLERAREWSLRDVALAFGVPAYMLGVPGDSSTYANVESRMIELRTFTLLPWQRRIEAVLDAQLPHGTGLKIASDALLRADTKTRYESYDLAVKGGWMTTDEVRALEDRPPLAGEAIA